MAISALALSACGESTDAGAETETDVGALCGPTCNGLLSGTDNRCELYDSNAYSSGMASCMVDAAGNCQVNTTSCVARSGTGTGNSADGAGGTNPPAEVGPFQMCDPQWNNCSTGSDCIGWGATAYCLVSCGGADDTTTCADVGGANGGTCLDLAGTVGSRCVKKSAGRDEPCLSEPVVCADETHVCSPTEYDYQAQQPRSSACKITCEAKDLGTQGTCPTGETCLAEPLGFMNIEPDATGNEIVCTDASQCGEGFACESLSDGVNQRKACASRVTWCGTQSEIMTSFDQASVQQFAGDAANQCNPWTGHVLCGQAGNDPDVADALFMCFDLNGGQSQYKAGACMGICEGDNETSLDCGDGLMCTIPTEGMIMQPQDRENMPPCTDDSACNPGYTCSQLQSGPTCARPMKMCVVDDGSGGLSSDPVINACGTDCAGLMTSTDCATLDATAYTSGTASCMFGSSNECAIDYSQCVAVEVLDTCAGDADCMTYCGGDCGTQVSSDQCADFNSSAWSGGTVSCSFGGTSGCVVDTSACVSVGSVCAGESMCENICNNDCGGQLTSDHCSDYDAGYTTGTVACQWAAVGGCQVVTSGCSSDL